MFQNVRVNFVISIQADLIGTLFYYFGASSLGEVFLDKASKPHTKFVERMLHPYKNYRSVPKVNLL